MDWDEDNDFDIISGDANGYVSLFRNIGTSTQPVLTDEGFLKANNSVIKMDSLSMPDICDWNEDGRKDLIVGCNGDYVYVYLNTGTNSNPEFGNRFTIEADGVPISYYKNCPRIADLNEDGLKDLAITFILGNCYYYPNSGTNADPVFIKKYELGDYKGTLDPTSGSNDWCHFSVCDWNEDGHPDLLYSNIGAEVEVYLGGAHNLQCSVVPEKPTVTIPPQGGSFKYDITLSNQYTEDVVCAVWTDIILPDGQPYGPVRIVDYHVKIPAGGTKTYTFEDSVPGTLPPSKDYSYAVFMGRMNNGYWESNSFPFSKKDILSADPLTLPVSGGIVNFELYGGPDNANRDYLLLGSLSGTTPGTLLPGGYATLPLNWDPITDLILSVVNSAFLTNFMGKLDGNGTAAAFLNTYGPLPQSTAGLTFYFAYACNKSWDFVSNPVGIEIVP